MRACSASLALLLAGCGPAPGLIAARVVVAADSALLEGERAFGDYDLAHQAQLAPADHTRYRTEQRPRVLEGFAALAGAAHTARQVVEIAVAGKVDPVPAVRAVCASVATLERACAAVGWSASTLTIAGQLCGEVAP
jgi:hypothetical protein